MAGKRPARHAGIHRSVHFEITEAANSGLWDYCFAIGNRNLSGRVQAILGLLAARRVKMKIDRALKHHASREERASPAPETQSHPEVVRRTAVRSRIMVAFTCEACNAAYEAVQVLVAAKGIFRCTVCYWPVHRWDGAHDYSRWRRLGENPRNP
ncbi:hypothetical protein ACRQ5Q_35195 [Bradyrhizobium sp. PMVTL-01]|uniref:hypothetical protein n=1 Tax=Bradyrhizobium sp. PMVTL-01 TaxID=3434999 RepID=UPI003F7038E5